ncbi:large conductance mechanosensitive channel protein MscL [Anaerobium acetethylicum]|uniref:Large-conductance mechanosensitive channel n=1 Tax=Anaerobium acetethylicum TaxID=1619234 RepID=A0A1D3TT65_9FIRM|nr:large conductance mechanosensitive channel protein MscL [Anaerobium acetethylicum]SCP97139.1 large conductance mechanosensitive channel [Anaerobium acetethylicum]
MLKEFKKFALKGNMVDLAVGVIIGAAFGALVTSLVKDIIMPIISLFTGKLDFSNLFFAMDGNKYETIQAATDAGVATINYGVFITSVINFIILAFVVFLLVKAITKLRKKEEEAVVVTTKKCPHCFTEIPLEATRCPNCTSELK